MEGGVDVKMDALVEKERAGEERGEHLDAEVELLVEEISIDGLCGVY